MQPNPVFLPGKSHGQMSLGVRVGVGGRLQSWGHKRVRHDLATYNILHKLFTEKPAIRM